MPHSVSRLSRQCGILYIAQPCRPLRPVNRDSFTFIINLGTAVDWSASRPGCFILKEGDFDPPCIWGSFKHKVGIKLSLPDISLKARGLSSMTLSTQGMTFVPWLCPHKGWPLFHDAAYTRDDLCSMTLPAQGMTFVPWRCPNKGWPLFHDAVHCSMTLPTQAMPFVSWRCVRKGWPILRDFSHGIRTRISDADDRDSRLRRWSSTNAIFWTILATNYRRNL
jgi:hypothetical protein